MAHEPSRPDSIGNPSIRFMLALLLLSLGVAWLVGLPGDPLHRLVPSCLLLSAGTVLLVRGIARLRSDRSE